jgi:hypothetical protein
MEKKGSAEKAVREIRRYLRKQENEDRQQDRPKFG